MNVGSEVSLSQEKIAARAWAIIIVAWGAVFIFNFAYYALGVILPVITKELHFGISVSGYLSSITLLVSVIITIPLAMVITRYSPRYTVVFVYIVLSISLLLVGTAHGTTQLYVGRALLAFGGAGISAPLAMMKSWWVPKERLGLVNGIEMFIWPLGQLVGTSGVAVLLYALGGWRMVMNAFGILGLIFAVIWLFVYRDNPAVSSSRKTEKEAFFAPLMDALKEKNVWLAGLGWTGTTLAWVILSFFWPTYATEVQGISLLNAGTVMGVLPIAAGLACLTGPILARWIGYDKPMIWPWGFILPVLYYLTLKVTSPVLLAVIFFLLSYGGWAWIPLVLSVIYRMPHLTPRAISLGVSIILTLTQLGGFLGAVNVGALAHTYGLGKVMLWCFMAPLTLGILTLFLPETGRKAMEKAAKEKAVQESA